jgi:hypothetical protein
VIFSPPVAHHALLLAVPFVVPMLVVTVGLGAMVIRDRLGGNRG